MSKLLTLSNLTSIFTEVKGFVASQVSGLVGSAPETLDTLKEIADALGNDPNLATTLTNKIGQKANTADVYTKTQADSTFATPSAVDTKLAPYAKTADMNTALAAKANSADVYTKTLADSTFAKKSELPSIEEVTAAEITAAAKAVFEPAA